MMTETWGCKATRSHRYDTCRYMVQSRSSIPQPVPLCLSGSEKESQTADPNRTREQATTGMVFT